MPSFINDNGYNGLGGLAQNYRRVSTGGSNYGTRRIQFYQITVYDITNAEAAKLDNYRAINNTEIDIDQEPEREFKSATVAELVIRAAQSVGEVYIVGAHDVDTGSGAGLKHFKITVGLAGDTFSSGNEMDERDDPATRSNDNPYMSDAMNDVLNADGAPSNDGFDISPVFIYGHAFSTTGSNA
jgi:hypothetical protein